MTNFKQATLLELSRDFAELDGYSLDLYTMIAGHSMYVFRGTKLNARFVQLHFSGALDLDIGNPMTNIHIRMATNDENALLVRSVTGSNQRYIEYPYSEMGYALEQSRIAIECNEGTFFIWARALYLSWWDAAGSTASSGGNLSADPLWDWEHSLWPGGPPLRQL